MSLKELCFEFTNQGTKKKKQKMWNIVSDIIEVFKNIIVKSFFFFFCDIAHCNYKCIQHF